MMHSDISRMVERERRREMLAAADRHRLASMVRREARAVKRTHRIASHDPTARRRQGLVKILLRRMWSWRLG
jgi:hypothetical protein